MRLESWLEARRAESRGKLAYETLSGGADPARAAALRSFVEEAAASLADEAALEAVELFPLWQAERSYETGDRVRYEAQGGPERLYRCEQAHCAQSGWEPPAASALWTEIARPGQIPVWRQPSGAQDAYHAGDVVRYPDEDGELWVSELDGNVWEPGVYGWQLTQATA